MTRLLLSAFAFVFALAIALDVSAQVVSPVQQSYGPYQRPAEGYEPAMASSRNAILLAWSEINHATRTSHIRFGLLDFQGRLISPIMTIPTSGRAEWPAVATDGTNFRLVYFEYKTEPRIERRYAMGVDIDAAGMVTNGVYELRAYDRAPANSFPIVYWNGSSFTFVDRLIDEAAAVIDERLSGAVWTTKMAFSGCFLFQCHWTEVVELNWWAVNGMNGSYRPSQSQTDIGALAMAGRSNYATVAHPCTPTSGRPSVATTRIACSPGPPKSATSTASSIGATIRTSRRCRSSSARNSPDRTCRCCRTAASS